jgi:2'-5' RNA ligase
MPDPGETPSKYERLFFALWPEAALREQIVGCSKPIVQAARGRAVTTENLHITLAFLGNVDVSQRACIEEMAGAIDCPPFDVTLDHSGHWSRSRVLCLMPADSPAPLSQLAEALQSGASACGLSLDDSRAYRPHLTLMRKVAFAPEVSVVEPIHWSVSGFALLRSVPVPQGVRYDVLREWPLVGVS